jgi:hypothetical protein
VDFSRFPQNLVLQVHPKSEGKSFDLEKTYFRKVFPCVEVTLVSEFHLIWCLIAQESKLGRKGRILDKKMCFQIPPVGQSLTLPDKIRNFQALSSPNSDIVQPRVSVRCSCTVLATVCYPGVRLIPFSFHCVHSFEGITSTLLVSMFITFLKSFRVGV